MVCLFSYNRQIKSIIMVYISFLIHSKCHTLFKNMFLLMLRWPRLYATKLLLFQIMDVIKGIHFHENHWATGSHIACFHRATVLNYEHLYSNRNPFRPFQNVENCQQMRINHKDTHSNRTDDIDVSVDGKIFSRSFSRRSRPCLISSTFFDYDNHRSPSFNGAHNSFRWN